MSTPIKERKKHWVWEYFRREIPSGKLVPKGICNACGDSSSCGHINRMFKHLNECKKIAAPIRKLITERQKRDDRKIQSTLQASTSDNMESEQEQQFLFTEEINELANLELTEALVTSGVPHSFVDIPAFTSFCQLLQPFYKLPNRQNVSQTWIPRKFNEVSSIVEAHISRASFVSLSSDGWTDIKKTPIINFVVHTPTTFLKKCVDTSGQPHTGDYLASLMIAEIDELGPSRVVTFTCDHAANIANAFKKINATYPWIVCIGCKAHALHLVCTDICKIAQISTLIDFCRVVTSFFNRKTPNSLLPDAQLYHYRKKFRLVTPSNVRWGTIHAMVESILKSIEAIMQVLIDVRITGNNALKSNAQEIYDFLKDGQNLQSLKEIESILRPLASTIKEIEGDQLNSTKAYFKALNAFDSARIQTELATSFDADIKNEIYQIFSHRKDFANSPVFNLSQMLDPVDKGASLDNDQKISATRILIDQILKNPILEQHQRQAITEWAEWKASTGVFADPLRAFAWEQLETEKYSAHTFWSGFFDDTILSKVVTMLVPIAATSASTERYWSARGYVHSKRRASLSFETANMEAYICFNLKRFIPASARARLQEKNIVELQNQEVEPIQFEYEENFLEQETTRVLEDEEIDMESFQYE